ncbi:hypothetical protein RRG08_021714 [Elysia crispata]|uniref:Secreted protein n=1 Tax=Elysia crispata TaxID=231223 RepID=A0AAE0ZZP4_9GAST|nr:hypothetical protein RRG08_021714 [Elysia crispata]
MITHAVAGSVVVVAAVVVDANAATQVAATSISVGHASRVLTNRGRGVGAAKCAPVEGQMNWMELVISTPEILASVRSCRGNVTAGRLRKFTRFDEITNDFQISLDANSLSGFGLFQLSFKFVLFSQPFICFFL